MPLIDSALKVVFCDNNLENSRHPELLRALITSEDLVFAFTTLEAYPDSALDIFLKRTVYKLV